MEEDVNVEGPTFRLKVWELLESEIAENQILMGRIETLDPKHNTCIVKVWRRATEGPFVEELQCFVDEGEDGKLHCRQIRSEP